MKQKPTGFKILCSINKNSRASLQFSSPTVAFKVDFCWKAPRVICVLQCAQDGRLFAWHSEQHHQYGTQDVALHHFHRIMKLLLEQSLTVSLNQSDDFCYLCHIFVDNPL